MLVRHVRLYALLRKQIYPLAHEAQILPDRASKEARVPRVSDPERSRVLRRMQTIADAWGGKVTVGFLPFHRDLMGGAPGDRPGLAQAQDWSASMAFPWSICGLAAAQEPTSAPSPSTGGTSMRSATGRSVKRSPSPSSRIYRPRSHETSGAVDEASAALRVSAPSRIDT